MNSIQSTSLNMPNELGLPTTIDPQAVAEVAADVSTANLLGVQQDIQKLAIQTAVTSSTSSSKASTLTRMTRNLNMV